MGNAQVTEMGNAMGNAQVTEMGSAMGDAQVTEMGNAQVTEMGNAMESAEKKRGEEEDDAGGGIDVISGISDSLLTTILSFLPTRDAARTALLSSRWRHLWKSVPLHLHDCITLPINPSSDYDDDDDDESRARAISSILASHLGPVQRFCLIRTLFRGRESLAHSWFQTLARKRVQHVDLDYLDYLDCPSRRMEQLYLDYLDYPAFPSRRMPHVHHDYLDYLDYPAFSSLSPDIPASLLACESLLTLRLCNSRFPDTTKAHLNLIRLAELTLSFTRLTDDDLESIISSCTALRSLAVESNTSIRQIHLRSGSLLSLTLSSCRNLKELIIEDAPNLERLIGRDLMSTTRVKVVGAPKLAVLGVIEIDIRIERLQLGNSVFMMSEQSADTTLSSFVHSLKTLAVEVRFNSYEEVKMLADFLRCFPCLERLHIECSVRSSVSEPAFEYWELLGPIACIDRHLKTVKLNNYIGTECDLEFVKFLFAKARMLKVMRFEFACFCCDSSILEQKRLLCLLNRASADTQISFFKQKDTQISFFEQQLHMRHFNTDACNLSFSDPFDS